MTCLSKSEDILHGKVPADLDYNIIRGILYPAHGLGTRVLITGVSQGERWRHPLSLHDPHRAFPTHAIPETMFIRVYHKGTLVSVRGKSCLAEEDTKLQGMYVVTKLKGHLAVFVSSFSVRTTIPTPSWTWTLSASETLLIIRPSNLSGWNRSRVSLIVLIFCATSMGSFAEWNKNSDMESTVRSSRENWSPEVE